MNRQILRVLRERRLFVIICLVLGVLGAGVATRLVPQVYSAQVTMFVAGSPTVPPVATSDTPAADSAAPQTANADSALQARDQLAQDRMPSYVQLLTSDRITAPSASHSTWAFSPPNSPAG